MLHLWLTIVLILSSLLQLGTGLKIGFGDDDKKATEVDGSVRMSVRAKEAEGSVTVEVVPMTVDDYISLTGDDYILESIGDAYDPAENDDFNSSVHTIVIESKGEQDFMVDIVDDSVSEFEEVFILFLRVINFTNIDESDIEITQNTSIIRIRVDYVDAYETSISLVLVNTSLTENDGLVPDGAYVEIEGAVESPVTVLLSVTPRDATSDIRLVQTEIQIFPNETRVPVALEVVKDSIAEFQERATLYMVIPQEYSVLFSGLGSRVGVINIIDSNVPVVGFVEDPSHVLFEGETTEVCVLLTEPDTVERLLTFEVSYTTESGLSISGDLDFGFYVKPYKHCFNVSFDDNDVISYPLKTVFSIDYVHHGGLLHDPVFQPGNITLTIKDNDGLPMVPTDIEMQYFNNNSDVLITWKSTFTDLQPIDEYVILVEPKTSSRHRQADQEKGLNSVVEYYTPWTHFLFEGIDQQPSITVKVCAENHLGRTCTKTLNFETIVPSSAPIMPSEEKRTLEWKYLIPIIVLAALLVIVCLILLLVAIVICVCVKSRSKHYYPAKQEQRMESTRRSFAEGRYKMRETPSTESVEWIGKPSDDNGMWNEIKKDLELKSKASTNN